MPRKFVVYLIIFAFVLLGAVFLRKNVSARVTCTPSSLESGDCVDDFKQNSGPTAYDTSPGIDVSCYSGKSTAGIGGGGLQQCKSTGAVKGEAFFFSTYPNAVDPSANQNASIFVCVNASGQLNDGLCWGWNKNSIDSRGSGYYQSRNVYEQDGGSIRRGYRYFVLEVTVHDNGQNPNWHNQHLYGKGTKVSGGPSVKGNTITWLVSSADNAILKQNDTQVAGGALFPPYIFQGGSYDYISGPTNFNLQVTGPDENGIYTTFNMPVDISNSSAGSHLACGQGACVRVPNGSPGQGNDDGCTVEGAACGGGPGPGGGRFKCTGNGAECAFAPGDAGPNQCSPPSDSVCSGSVRPPTIDTDHLECQGTACVVLPGGGADQCNTNTDCGGVVPVGPTCGTMQQDFAIRGCSGYVERSPVSKPDAVSCVSYCGENSANACEWNSANGDCYVEFGIGCSVEGGYPGWYAAVMSSSCGSSATHSVCSGSSCVQVSGAGSNQCNSNTDCGGPPPTHTVCQGDGSCTSVGGAGTSRCSSWSDCPQPPPSCSFSASPNRVIVPPPAHVSLSWSCSYADSCTIGGIGPVGASGSQSVSVDKDTTYAMNCSGRGGSASFNAIVRAFEYSGGKLKEVAP